MKKLNAKHLLCPLPVLRARKVLQSMVAGEQLEITVTDPTAVEDFKLFCDEARHILCETRPQGDHYIIVLECAV